MKEDILYFGKPFKYAAIIFHVIHVSMFTL